MIFGTGTSARWCIAKWSYVAVSMLAIPFLKFEESLSYLSHFLNQPTSCTIMLKSDFGTVDLCDNIGLIGVSAKWSSVVIYSNN